MAEEEAPKPKAPSSTKPKSSKTSTQKPTAAKTAPKSADTAHLTNGKPAATTKTAAAPKAAPKKKATATKVQKPQASAPVDRAEDVLDEVGKKLGGLLSVASNKLRKAAAVAKEEVEDLWAEAQSIRRGDIK
jgi:hypothetical protein